MLAAPVLGMVPRATLARTRLIDGFAGSDYVLICELAMLGPVVQLDELTMLRRLHPDSSREANRSRADVRAWFDPGAGKDRLSDRQRLFVEYHRSAASLGLPVVDRALCHLAIPTALGIRRSRVRLGALKARLLGRTIEPHARDLMDERARQEADGSTS